MDAVQHIRDFLKAADAGWLGEMPAGFNRSAFVVALRTATQKDAAPVATVREQVIAECIDRIRAADYEECERDTASRTINRVLDKIAADLRAALAGGSKAEPR